MSEKHPHSDQLRSIARDVLRQERTPLIVHDQIISFADELDRLKDLADNTVKWCAEHRRKDAAELDRLTARVAELEKGPTYLFMRRGTQFDLFESLDDVVKFGTEHGGTQFRALSWTHHPASKPEPAEEGQK